MANKLRGTMDASEYKNQNLNMYRMDIKVIFEIRLTSN